MAMSFTTNAGIISIPNVKPGFVMENSPRRWTNAQMLENVGLIPSNILAGFAPFTLIPSSSVTYPPGYNSVNFPFLVGSSASVPYIWPNEYSPGEAPGMIGLSATNATASLYITVCGLDDQKAPAVVQNLLVDSSSSTPYAMNPNNVKTAELCFVQYQIGLYDPNQQYYRKTAIATFWRLNPTDLWIKIEDSRGKLFETMRDGFIDIAIPPTTTSPLFPGVSGGTGGGGGDYTDPDNPTELEGVEGLNKLSAINSGLVTAYSPPFSKVQALGNYLWGETDIFSNLKKIMENPIDCLISLSILPFNPGGTASTIKLGNLDTQIEAYKITEQYKKFSLGTYQFKEFFGSFLDYAPYTVIDIYLPYIGWISVIPEAVMNKTIGFNYTVDCLSGSCVCTLLDGDNVLNTYSGNCKFDIPLTGRDYTSNYREKLSSIISGATGAITAGISGGPVNAAISAGASAANSTTQFIQKPGVEKDVSLTPSIGLIEPQSIIIKITRPEQQLPDNYAQLGGYPAHITMRIGDCKGFTQCSVFHLDNIPARYDEKQEIEQLLKEGVIV